MYQYNPETDLCTIFLDPQYQISFSSVEQFLEMKLSDKWTCETTPLHVSFMIFFSKEQSDLEHRQNKRMGFIFLS
jgi:hypothetical protein